MKKIKKMSMLAFALGVIGGHAILTNLWFGIVLCGAGSAFIYYKVKKGTRKESKRNLKGTEVNSGSTKVISSQSAKQQPLNEKKVVKQANKTLEQTSQLPLLAKLAVIDADMDSDNKVSKTEKAASPQTRVSKYKSLRKELALVNSQKENEMKQKVHVKK